MRYINFFFVLLIVKVPKARSLKSRSEIVHSESGDCPPPSATKGPDSP